MSADASQINRIEKYSSMVYRLAFSLLKSRSDADDIHQEVFLNYIAATPVFESENHAKAWFIRVTVNLCRNWWKSAWRRRTVSLGEMEAADTGSPGVAGNGLQEPCLAEFLLSEEENRVMSAAKSLPPKYRAVIHLFYYEEMSVEEVASALGRKPATVRTQLTRARRQLKDLLQEEVS